METKENNYRGKDNGADSISIYAREMEKICKKYFPNVTKTEYLTEGQITTLYQKYRTGDKSARLLLIYSQLRLTHHYANIFYKQFGNNMYVSMDLEDVLGFANELLIKHIDSYDQSKGLLPSYIRTFVGNGLHVLLKENGRTIRLPHSRIIKITQKKKMVKLFMAAHDRYPNQGETIQYKDKKGEEFVYEFQDTDCYETISGNTPLRVGDKHGENVGIEVFDAVLDNVEETNQYQCFDDDVLAGITTLTDSEKDIIKYVYGRESKNIQKKDLPLFVRPDNKKEEDFLLKTSKSLLIIDISYENYSESLEYSIVCNKHQNNQENGSIVLGKKISPTTHHFQKIFTNQEKDYFSFETKNAQKIVVRMLSHSEEIIIPHLYNGNTLRFDVTYPIGRICSAMTCMNKKNKVLEKLRIELAHLKQELID